MPSVTLPSVLAPSSAHRTLAIDAASVREVLAALEASLGLDRAFITADRQRLMSHVRVFLNEREIDQLDGLDTALRADDHLTILVPVAGG